MYHIVEAMTRWLAPILSFTADEVWGHIPGERAESVFLVGWYEGLFALDARTPSPPPAPLSPGARGEDRAGVLPEGDHIPPSRPSAAVPDAALPSPSLESPAPLSQEARGEGGAGSLPERDRTFDRSFWDRILAARVAVSPHLEAARKTGAIGSSLDAELDLWCDAGLRETLGRLGDELRFVLICSYVRLHPMDERPAEAADTELPVLAVRVSTSAHPKCVRCWHHRADVGVDPTHPELCGRCVKNVAGGGETRRYA
jgi:isoleucyl-tRNA synthetase